VLIVRAPVRLSLAGGGTDLEAYYARHDGLVVSVTLDKYFYVFVTATGDPAVQIASSDFRAFFRHRDAGEDEEPLWDSDLALPRAVLRQFGINRGYHLFLASEIPPGTGLGSSSAVAVALIKALATLTDRPMSRADLADLACHIEIDQLRAPIGRQDQYAAAFGGLNAITFRSSGIEVEPLTIDPRVRAQLEDNLLLFFTGSSRKANTILSEQRRRTNDDPEVVRSLHLIRAHAQQMRRAIESGDIDAVGDLLHQSWIAKRQLASGVSNERIDRLYTLARERGAAGGKITGAGGGGFLLLYCEPSARAAVIEAMESEGLYRMEFRFDTGGARVLVNNLSSPGMPIRMGGALAEVFGGAQ
jgi:D-glycero-alpha-D-manno-heptose-7-phosphate kinase